jgi:ferritin
MLSKTLHDAMNHHFSNELYASHLYLSMSAYCDSINMPGFAHWMLVQAEEERGHAMRFYGFIRDRGGRVIVPSVEQPPIDFKSPLDVFEQALEHEQLVAAKIHELYGLAVEEKDYPSQAFLQWFVTEQVEEEKMITQTVETLRMIENNSVALLMLDRELGSRQTRSSIGAENRALESQAGA